MKSLLQSITQLLLLCLLPSLVWAQTYNLPANPPPGCSASGNVVSCNNWITLGSSVVITVSSPVTFNMNGGAIQGAQINVGGNPANLTINVNGGLNLGSNTHLVASLSASNVYGSGASNVRMSGALTVNNQLQLGSGAQVIGDVAANTFSTGTGSVISGDISLQGNFSPFSDTQVYGVVTAAGIQASGVSNLTIEGDVTLSAQLALGSQSHITGNIVAGSMDTGQNNTITGDVSLTGALGLGQGSTINGNVDGSLINIFNQASVTGTVQSGGNINLSQGAAVGPVIAGGSLSAGTNVVINGSIDVGGQVTLGEYSVVHGGIQAETQVTIHDHVVIHGSVATNGQVTVNEDVTVYGGVTAGTDIQIHNRSHIHGDLVGNDIHIFLDAMIEGSVEAQGVVTNAGVIQGNINAQGDVWLNGSGLCLVEVDGRLEPQQPGSGGTQGCVSGYVNAPNDHQIPPENVGGLICDQNVNIGPCAGSGGGPLVTMYRIINPGTALTCEPLELQVFACADPNCQTGLPVTGAVSVQATPVSGPGAQGTGNFADDSVAAVNLSITETGTYTLSLSAVPEEAADPFQCAGPQGCSVTAVDALLRWNDVSHRTSGVPFTLEVEAIRADDNNASACAPALQGLATLDVSLQCTDPGECTDTGLQFSTLAGTAVAEWPGQAAVPVSFDANGRAVLSDITYEDAGRIRLHAAADIGSSVLSGWSDEFVVTPHHIGIQVTNPVTYSANILARAGDELPVTLTALSANDLVTRNFGLESTSESLMLLPTGEVVTPAGGVDGLITIVDALELTEGGEFTGNIQYSEVGTARFRAMIHSQNYLGSQAGATGETEVGRFLPWKFHVETLQTGVTMACEAPSSIPGFTYLDEPFRASLRVSARNRDGGVTKNYPDIVGAGASATLVARNRVDSLGDGFDLSERLAVMPLDLTWPGPGDSMAGYGSVATDNVLMERSEVPIDWNDLDDENPHEGPGPFDQVAIGVEIDDNEPGGPFVPLAGADFRADVDDCAADVSCTAVTLVEDARFVHGEMILTDTMGSEFSPLPVSLQVHYWDGERFRVHQHDQCTVLDVDNLAIINNVDNLDVEPFGENDATLSNGFSPTGSLMLSAPVAAGEDPLEEPGVVTFRYQAPAWLQSGAHSECPTEDPSADPQCHPEATATFGTYGGHDRVIHWRLVH